MNRFSSVVIVFTLLLCTIASYSQPCLQLIHAHDPQNGLFNPDSMKIDMCSSEPEIWFKGAYRAYIRCEAFLPASTPDSLGFYGIDALDSTASCFAALIAINTELAPITLRRDFAYPSDTSLDRHWMYKLYFSEYVSKKICDSILTTCPVVYSKGIERPAIALQGNTRVNCLKRDLTLEEVISPEPLYTPPAPTVPYQHRGVSGYLREIRVPQAWEITKGNREVYIGLDDNFSEDTLVVIDSNTTWYTPHYDHPDLHMRNQAGVGNLIHPPLYLSTEKVGFFSNSRIDSTGVTDPYGTHGITVAVIANGEDNSNGTNPDEGLIGVAPHATSFATLAPKQYQEYDMKADSGMQYPHIVNRSYRDFTGSLDYLSLSHGVVTVTVLHNNQEFPDPDADTSLRSIRPYTLDTNQYGFPVSIGEFHYLGPVHYPPAGSLYADPSDPTNSHKDIKVITVAGYESISQTFEDAEDCKPLGVEYLGISRGRNFCLGIEKYPMDETFETRWIKKEKASVDVVCAYPTVECMAGVKQLDYVNVDTLYYNINTQSGNSYCAPQVSGVIALMMSVEDRLGKTGFDVQRKAYNIVTFTTDKIHDPGIPTHVDSAMKYENRNSNSRIFYDVDDTAPGWAREYSIPNILTKLRLPELLNNGYLKTEYQAQPNDPLKRYWALRVGYGRVNAFRCVAHAIPNIVGANPTNVQYEYNSGSSLNWTNAKTVEGRKLLHLGKFKSAGVYVLDSGGIVPDGEPAVRNNNGKTVVNTVLTVGTNNTLAIDGILASTQTNGGSISTTGNGKILATGWVDKVSLEGEVCWSDLRVTRATAGNAIIARGNSIGRDTLWLKGKSKLQVTNGSLTLEETAVIILQDSAKIEVTPTGKLVLESGAKIIEDRTPLPQAIKLLPSIDTTIRATLASAKNARRATINVDISVGKNGRINLDGRAPYPFSSLRTKNITLDSGAVITVDQVGTIAGVDTTAMLFMSPTSKIVVASGDSCYVDLKVTIHPKAEIHAMGLCAVGTLKANNNSLIKVYPGGVLGLLRKENIVHGKLIVMGDSTAVAAVKAINDARCTVSQNVIPNLTLYPQQWLTTFTGGSNLDSVVSKLTGYLSAEKALFHNVCTKLQNFPIIRAGATPAVTSLLQNVEFRINRKEFFGAIDDILVVDSNNNKLANVLLYVGWDERLHTQQRNSFGYTGGASPALRSMCRVLTVTSCKFHDVASKIDKQKPREAFPEQNYVVTGLMLNNMRKCKVDNNLFAFVYNGLHTTETDYTITNNKVAGCVNGFRHVGRGGVICSNRVGGASQGVLLENSNAAVINNKLGAIMSTSWNSLLPDSINVKHVGYGFQQLGTSNSALVNNTFEYYAAAINAQAGTVVAQDRMQFSQTLGGIRGSILENGRNKFIGTPLLLVEGNSLAVNPYYDPKTTANSDVFWETKALIDIECGLNDFSDQQRYHLQRNTGIADQVVSTNDFNLAVNTLTSIRVKNVTPTGAVLDQAEMFTNPPCTGVVAPMDPEVNCLDIPELNPEADLQWDYTYPALADVRLFKMPKPDIDTSSGIYIQEYYDASKYWSLANGLDVHTRSEYMINAAETVPNIPTAILEGDYLVGQYSAIASDTLEPIVLRQAAAVATSKIFTSREQWGIAADYLESHLGSVFTELDSALTVFRIADMRNNGDTTISTPNRINQAIHIAHRSTELSNSGGGFGKERSGNQKPTKNSSTEPESNYSVFYTQRTGEITVKVLSGHNEPQQLELYSLQGAELGAYALRVNATQNTHVCTPTGLPAGVYIVRVLDKSDSNKHRGMLLQVY